MCEEMKSHQIATLEIVCMCSGWCGGAGCCCVNGLYLNLTRKILNVYTLYSPGEAVVLGSGDA